MARVVGLETVIGGIVQTPVAERGTGMVRLGRMVEDDINQDLEAGPCKASTIDLNSPTWPPGRPARTSAE